MTLPCSPPVPRSVGNHNFQQAVQPMSLHTLWSNTKVQKTDHELPIIPGQVMGNIVEATEWFTYLGLGSAIDSSGRSSQMFTVALDWPPVSWTDCPISGGSPGLVSPLN